MIAGSDDGYNGSTGYATEMKELSTRLGTRNVEFVGEVQGLEKKRLFQKSELFVLPSYSENYGMAVAESLAAGTPAIVSKGAPWHGLTMFHAGWHVDIGIAPLVQGFRNALAHSPDQLKKMGENGRMMMAEFNSWERIGAMMLETYEWLLFPKTTRPPWIHVL